MPDIDTHNLIVDFGKHKGKRWTRVPVGYLKWLSNNADGERNDIAQAELNRRGTTTPSDLVLSGHAIDRASQCTDEWKEEGVFSWLTKLANQALDKLDQQCQEMLGCDAPRLPGEDEVIEYNGYKLVFNYGKIYPTLKTIIKR